MNLEAFKENLGKVTQPMSETVFGDAFNLWLEGHLNEEGMVLTDCCKTQLPPETVETVSVPILLEVGLGPEKELLSGWMFVYLVVCGNCKEKVLNARGISYEAARTALAELNGGAPSPGNGDQPLP